jgi:hypothetical protein
MEVCCTRRLAQGSRRRGTTGLADADAGFAELAAFLAAARRREGEPICACSSAQADRLHRLLRGERQLELAHRHPLGRGGCRGLDQEHKGVDHRRDRPGACAGWRGVTHHTLSFKSPAIDLIHYL